MCYFPKNDIQVLNDDKDSISKIEKRSNLFDPHLIKYFWLHEKHLA